jgi:siroheme synthase (precorrin-2 oxidase/ferrochelatase)
MKSNFMQKPNPSKTVESTKLTYHQRNCETLNAKARARRAANPEKNREQCRRYAKSHREQVNARVRRWQKRMNPEKFHALQRQYRLNSKARKLLAMPPVDRRPV